MLLTFELSVESRLQSTLIILKLNHLFCSRMALSGADTAKDVASLRFCFHSCALNGKIHGGTRIKQQQNSYTVPMELQLLFDGRHGRITFCVLNKYSADTAR